MDAVKRIKKRLADIWQAADEVARSKAIQTIEAEAQDFLKPFLKKEKSARRDMILLNAAVIFVVAKDNCTLEQGVKLAGELLDTGKALETLKSWVLCQNREPARGEKKLSELLSRIS